MENRYLKPAPGALVRDPVTLKPLDAEGEWKPMLPYWHRRIRQQDVTEATPPAAQAAPAAQEAPAASPSPISAPEASADQAPAPGILAALQRDAAS
ncbi:TPA: DUF2635 domain-containing protein [Escherichia coli]|jgi:hypothetical protein|nr:DUF2635 domain-containing protein [Bradyrhizobium sp.]MCA3567290.1 DUF2635 domain-containing protein [Bradyrhizobium sp.]MCA3575760.1 DUF2635 domain-containing protein [Bradyrhizobium sp.]